MALVFCSQTLQTCELFRSLTFQYIDMDGSSPSFVAHQQPFPIVLADSIPPTPDPATTLPGDTVPLTSEIWEFNVCEFRLYRLGYSA